MTHSLKISAAVFGVLLLVWSDALAQVERPRRGGRGSRQEAPPPSPPPETKPAPVDDVPDEYLAVVGADIYQGRGNFIRQGTLLSKNGKILSIGTSVSLPKDTLTIEAPGYKVYPGMVAISSSGFLGGGNPEDSTDVFGLSMIMALGSGITTTTSGNSVAKLTFGTVDGMILKEGGVYNFDLSRTSGLQRHQLRERFDAARNYLRDLAEYELAKKQGRADEDPNAKSDLPDEIKKTFSGRKISKPEAKGLDNNILALLKGESVAQSRANTASEILETARFAQEYGFRVVVDGAQEGWVVASDMGRSRMGAILYPRLKMRPDLSTNRPSGFSIENARILWEHGADLALMPPGNGISLNGIAGRDLMTLHMDAAYAVRGGLPEWAAIEAVTMGPARLLGVDHRIGSLDIGKDADFIVCHSDLLDYRNRVEWTVVNGKIAYDKEKESIFRQIRPRSSEAQLLSPVEMTESEAEEARSEVNPESEAKTEGGESTEGAKDESKEESGGGGV